MSVPSQRKPDGHRGAPIERCSYGEGGQRPKRRKHGLRILWVTLRKTVPLFGVHLGEVAFIAFPGMKESVDTNKLLCSLASEQRQMLRVANPDASFLLCFTINSEPLDSPWTNQEQPQHG